MKPTKQLRPHQKEAIDIIAKTDKGIINLPTGTGKSFIQSNAIICDIKKQSEHKVYVITSPRIMLANQLLRDVKADLDMVGIDCQLLAVHSGNPGDIYQSLVYRQINSTTSPKKISEEYERAQAENVPLIISSTYDSIERIKLSGIPIEILHCDEAHYIVRPEFSWVATDFPTVKQFFYTATLRETGSELGMGMDNKTRFGDVLYKRTPLEMINAGEIVRPRLHIVTCEKHPEADEADALAVIEAFKEHKSLLNIGAKMLVCTKGSEHLNNLVTHREFQKLKLVRPNLTIFDISSVYQPRIDGVVVKREDFLSRLQNMSDTDDAIILHIDILTEGIDVPGITGVMLLNDMSKAKFLQSLGRATRLFITDRQNLYSKKIKSSDLDLMVKPYAYIIVPNYGDFGEDVTQHIKTMVYELRSFGFNPAEHVIIKQQRGKQIPVPLAGLNELDTRKTVFADFFATVEHDIESEEEANEVHDTIVNIQTLSDLENVVATQSYETVKSVLSSKTIKKLYNEQTIVTPFTLIEEMLDALPKEVWGNKDLKWCDVATGRGAYLYAIKQRLMIGLVGVIADSDEREQHIVSNMLYGYDVDLVNCEFAKAVIDPLKSYSVNIYNKDYLSEENMKKFDIIVGNPPYQKKVGEKKTEPIWNKFVLKALDNLKDNGYMCLIHPAGWRDVSGKFKNVQNELLKNQILYLEMHNEKDGLAMLHAETKYDWYCLKKSDITIETRVKDLDGVECNINLQNLNFIPNSNFNNLFKLVAKKCEPTVEILSDSSYHTQRDFMKNTKSNKYKYPCTYMIRVSGDPVYWYSDRIDLGHFGKSKIIWGNGGTGIYMDSTGDCGMTQFTYGLVDDKENLPLIKKALLSDKFKKLMLACTTKTASDFNHRVISTFRKDFWKEFI